MEHGDVVTLQAGRVGEETGELAVVGQVGVAFGRAAASRPARGRGRRLGYIAGTRPCRGLVAHGAAQPRSSEPSTSLGRQPM